MASLSPPSESLREHYRALFVRHGPGHRAVQWSSLDAQIRRFEVLADVVGVSDVVVDLGCGLGDLLIYLREERAFSGSYLGLDVVPEFIEHARRHFAADRQAEFRISDAGSASFPAADCFLVSGMFNNQLPSATDNEKLLFDTVQRAFAASRKAVAFNALSALAHDHVPSLFYFDPGEVMRWCARNLTRRLTVRHDYSPPPETGIPTDFTLYLYK